MTGLFELEEGGVRIELSKGVYGPEALGSAAAALQGRAEVLVGESKRGWDVSVRPSEGADFEPPDLARMFLSEILAQEYRLLNGSIYGDLSQRFATRQIYSARGEDSAGPAPSESKGYRAEVEAMLKKARENFGA